MENFEFLHGIYAITDAKLMGPNLIDMVEQSILGGIHILQYRNKTADIEQQEKEAQLLSQLCKKRKILFLVNDDIELAIKVDADGVHLGQNDTLIKEARNSLGKNKIIGITCHNKIELAQKAQNDGADYVAFGRFYPSKTKPNATQANLSLISSARKLISIPIVAIGGITPDCAPSLLKEGAHMLAIVHGIFGQHDILHATRQFVKIYNTIDTPKRQSDL